MDSREFQQRAREAESKSWSSTSQDLRVCWLDVAEAWLLLAKNAADREIDSRRKAS